MKPQKHWYQGVERCHHPRCAEPGFRGCYYWPSLVALRAGDDEAAEMVAAAQPPVVAPPEPAQPSLFALAPPTAAPARKKRRS